LFQLTNEFSVLYQNDKQKGDYDPVFLDWMFWFFLAPVEFTDRLNARD
jgi:hypothetical protein